MRKIHSEIENPFDNFLYIFVEFLAPYAYKLGFSPDMITTLSVIFSLASIYYLYIHSFGISIFLYIISYFFDCLDGYVARKYNMVSKFGDLYDHISDLVSFIGYNITLYLINPKLFTMFLPIILFFLVGSQIHLAYQELYYNKPSESAALNLLTTLFIIDKKMGKSKIHDIMKYTRYFGVGTLHMSIVCITLIYSNFYSIKYLQPV